MIKSNKTNNKTLSINKKVSKVLILIILIIVYFLICEQIIRFENFGTNSFSPRKMENIRHVSTYKFASGCDLNANFKDYVKGAWTETNSMGLRDEEYSLEKENGTFRIAIIGDSTSNGIGVKIEDVYHTIFEDKLNNRSTNKSFEVISLSRGGIQNDENQTCYFKKINDSLHYDVDMVIIQVWKGGGNWFNNNKSLEKIENHTKYSYMVFMFFNEDEKIIKKYQNLTSTPIISLDVEHNNKDNIFPADWHPNEKIHKKYAESLYNYFIENEDDIYNKTKNLEKIDNLPELVKPPKAWPIKRKSYFLKSYYYEKLKSKSKNTLKVLRKNLTNFY
ncbi:SGNH/GDSL hydrolase family protein [Candidatus Woesearchaeota archaeon]|nr:SGNH/GDSL hydrolase family protein [Candidatus Woesearchaeota archaeon]